MRLWPEDAVARRPDRQLVRGLRPARRGHLPRPVGAHRGGYVQGKTLTSYASLKTDITNAGGSWVDKSVVRDARAAGR
ncbi:hypothetical protein SCYAM73S_07219 [Streptomyces cyaneofuscatus]